jgi:hypothetical protein
MEAAAAAAAAATNRSPGTKAANERSRIAAAAKAASAEMARTDKAAIAQAAAAAAEQELQAAATAAVAAEHKRQATVAERDRAAAAAAAEQERQAAANKAHSKEAAAATEEQQMHHQAVVDAGEARRTSTPIVAVLLGGTDDASLFREYASVAEAAAAIQCSDAQLKEAFDAGSEVRCVDGDDWYRILNLLDEGCSRSATPTPAPHVAAANQATATAPHWSGAATAAAVANPYYIDAPLKETDPAISIGSISSDSEEDAQSAQHANHHQKESQLFALNDGKLAHAGSADRQGADRQGADPKSDLPNPFTTHSLTRVQSLVNTGDGGPVLPAAVQPDTCQPSPPPSPGAVSLDLSSNTLGSGSDTDADGEEAGPTGAAQPFGTAETTASSAGRHASSFAATPPPATAGTNKLLSTPLTNSLKMPAKLAALQDQDQEEDPMHYSGEAGHSSRSGSEIGAEHGQGVATTNYDSSAGDVSELDEADDNDEEQYDSENEDEYESGSINDNGGLDVHQIGQAALRQQLFETPASAVHAPPAPQSPAREGLVSRLFDPSTPGTDVLADTKALHPSSKSRQPNHARENMFAIMRAVGSDTDSDDGNDNDYRDDYRGGAAGEKDSDFDSEFSN